MLSGAHYPNSTHRNAKSGRHKLENRSDRQEPGLSPCHFGVFSVFSFLGFSITFISPFIHPSFSYEANTAHPISSIRLYLKFPMFSFIPEQNMFPLFTK